MNGRKVAFVIIVPALVSSTKPITDASAVPLITCTRKPTVGGTATRSACGPITWRSCSRRLSASAEEASHWPLGTAATQPRQISVRNALV